MRVNPANREEAYAALKSSRVALMDAIAGLTPDPMAEPVLDDWSTKDLLAHIAVWEELTVPDIERVGRGHIPALAAMDPRRIDQWNDLLMSLRRNFSQEQVIFELEDCRHRLAYALEGLPDDAFEPGFILTVCGITATHDLDHADHIREWRSRRGL